MGCDPEINIVTLGAKILTKIKLAPHSLENILSTCPSEFGVSMDHIILTLDWLYAIKSINVKGDEVTINAIKNP